MRVLPNMTVISPCDATQAKIATEKAILECQGPVYIRFGREPVPDFTDENQSFEIGKAQLMQEGTDVTIVATGHEVWEALAAAHMLDHMGVSARVINMHTIKPLDGDILNKAAEDTRMIFTVEEHQSAGGLGGAVAEFLAECHPIRVIRIGMEDRFGESGQAQALLHKYGLDAAGIVNRVLEEIAKDDLSLYIRKMGLPFDTYPRRLYDSKVLYDGYDWHDTDSFKCCHDMQVYQHYLDQGKRGHQVRETLARALHDHFITLELYKMLDLYDEKDVIGIMGGHAKRRDDPQYRQIVFLSKRLTEMKRGR